MQKKVVPVAKETCLVALFVNVVALLAQNAKTLLGKSTLFLISVIN